MKDKIHPKYQDIKVECACGAVYEIGSTKPSIRIDICSNCHPLFTGKQKLMDIEGRVDKFKKKYTAASLAPKKKKERAAKPKREKPAAPKKK